MKALVATGDAQTPIEPREVDEPAVGPDQPLVEVRALSLNRGELRLLATRAAGWRPGQDIAGVVVRAAADGSGPPQGARVVALVDQAGWAQRVAVPSSRLAVLPESVSFAAAASLPVAGLTALRALRLGGMLLGRSVLVTGAAGGVGHFAVQLAARSGARVTGVARGERARGLRELGASEVVTRLADLEAPFDLILESTGGASLTTALRLVGRDGLVVLFGNSSGEESQVSFASFVGHPHARLYAFFVYESGEPPSFGADLRLLASEIATGHLRPQVGFEGTWTDLPGAMAALRERQVEGKAVLHVEP